MDNQNKRNKGSFRDPSGFLYSQGDTLYRQVNNIYKTDYQALMDSGLYDELVAKEYLIPHKLADVQPPVPETAYIIIQPNIIPFISYPYEWSFTQLKDAALTTLAVQKAAFAKGLILKDASAYNIQFYKGKPILIDTLSFEIYKENTPWVAYRQFCQHFLAPLALMAQTDERLSKLMCIYIDGIPLDLASNLLPTRTRLSPSLLMHIHLHASAQKRYATPDVKKDSKESEKKLSRNSLIGIIDSLESAIRKQTWKSGDTEWADYYNNTNYSTNAATQKHQIVSEFLSKIQPQQVWDLGANDGTFSRLASDQGIETVAFDIDPTAVENNYLRTKSQSETHLLPLQMDLTNPSASIGWHSQERQSLLERGPADAVLALALIHHLAIGNNVPLPELTRFFSDTCQWLIIEFIPKSDSQVQILLAGRKDIFINYTQDGFESAFSELFEIIEKQAIFESERMMYLMKRRS